MRPFTTLLALVCVFFTMSLNHAAMMPAEDIEAGNLQASDIVGIVVQQVRVITKNPLWQQVAVTARVANVQKSASGLKKDQKIRLLYEIPAPGAEIPSGYFGPSVPQAGARLTAYLDKDEDGVSYKPRALKPEISLPRRELKSAKPVTDDAGGIPVFFLTLWLE